MEDMLPWALLGLSILIHRIREQHIKKILKRTRVMHNELEESIKQFTHDVVRDVYEMDRKS